MERFLSTLMDALAVGSLYALIALGYTMVYGILKFINFAHSDVFVLGAWVSLASAVGAGWGTADAAGPVSRWVLILLATLTVWGSCMWAMRRGRVLEAGPHWWRTLRDGGPSVTLVGVCGLALVGLYVAARGLRGGGAEWVGGGVVLVIAMGACGLVGFSLERLAYKPLRHAPRLNVLITAIGVSLLLQNMGQLDWLFGTRPKRMPTLLPDRVLFEVGGRAAEVGADGSVIKGAVQGVQVHLLDVVCAATAVLLMVLLDRLVFATKLGRAMRAVSLSEKTAALMGIPVDRVISFTFVLGASLAAAAGFLYSQKYPGVNQTAAPVWVLLGLKAFVAAVIGGIGNVRGAMLGGLFIGLLEFFTRAFVPQGTQLCDVVVFGALILVLLLKPAGLLGRAIQEKV